MPTHSTPKKTSLPHALVILILLIHSGAVMGQNPFGDEESAPPPAPPGDAPAALAIDPNQYGPAVQTVLEADRRTPEELLQGVLLLIDLGEPELADPFFKRLLQAEIDDPTKASLARRFGTHRMMRLARARGLGTEAAPFADACMAALAAELRDPVRLAKLITELGDPAPEVRRVAIADLVETGPDAAPFCVAALADPDAASRLSGLITVLVQLRPVSVDPLIAALAVESTTAKKAVIQALGHVAPEQATIHLLAPALADPDAAVRESAAAVLLQTSPRLPTIAEAESILTRSVMAFMDGQLPAAPDADNRVPIWTWDTATQKPVMERYLARDASIHAAGQLADDLAALEPKHAINRELHLLCQFHIAKVSAGPDAPLPDVVKQMGANVPISALESVLAMAVAHDLIPAAIAVVEQMGDRGDSQVLYSAAPAITPLVQALRHGDRRLRFAALQAVMKIDPSEPFSGASHVPEAMDFFLQSGQPHAVVALPDRQRAQTVAGWLSSHGLMAHPAGTGREAVRAAIGSSDIEFILIDMTIHLPGIREVLYQLRSSPNTRRVPIGLLTEPDTVQRADQIAVGDPWTMHFTRPPDPAAVDAMTEKLRGLADRAVVPATVRAAQSIETLTWLEHLLERPRTFYDMRRLERAVTHSLATPALAERATVTLGHFGTKTSQRTLVDLASRQVTPIALREVAAGAFRNSVSRYGIQLTREEIFRQYDRYNASETADLQTQKVLGHVLDTIEKK